MMKYNEMLRTGGKAVSMLALLAGLNACATAAKPQAMAVAPQASAKPFPAPLQHAMCVRDVSGGEKTNPLWASKVDNAGFKTALTTSLDNAGLEASPTSCAYPIDAHLLGLSQPVMGIDMTVTSHVNYKVYDASGQPYLLATVDAPYTAKFSDAFIGVERLRMANEGSIRVSIEDLFDKLRTSQPKTSKAHATGEANMPATAHAQ